MNESKAHKKEEHPPKVTVLIVTVNAMKYLADLMRSLFLQKFTDFHVLVIDNNSEDDTVTFLRENYPTVTVLQNMKNLGLCKALNQGIRLSRSEYILVVDQNVVLEKDVIHKLVQRMDDELQIASSGGKVLKLTEAQDLGERTETLQIASAGLRMLKNRNTLERGAGELDTNQYNMAETVFGFPFHLVMYRRSALHAVSLHCADSVEYFDQDYFMYEADVDISWRLLLAGWIAFYDPDIVSYYYQGGALASRPRRIVRWSRYATSPEAFALGYRNHILLLIKNEQWSTLAPALFAVVRHELAKLLYAIFFQRKTLRALPQIRKMLSPAREKRKQVKKTMKVQPEEMLLWFGGK